MRVTLAPAKRLTPCTCSCAAPPPPPPPLPGRRGQGCAPALAPARGAHQPAALPAAPSAAVAEAAPGQRRAARLRCRSSSGDKNVSGGGSKNGSGKNGSAGGGGSNNGISLQNYELLIGDCLCLLCFALYKQITAIILLPSFPGWLAPLQFSPTRLLEFVSFSVTLLGTWVASGLLTGGYRFEATANVRAALSRVSAMWLISMPVAAAQLVLLTAAEDVALVGDEGWASALPLAATGPGEPFVTAAGVLGLMAVWRAFYAAYIDIYSFGKLEANSRDRVAEMEHFADSLRGAMLLSLACCAVLQFLGGLVGEEELEVMAASLLGLASASGR